MLHFRAPAKLNLYLRVLGTRPDGYHELETIFERIDLADELSLEAHPTLTLTCTDPELACGEENLVLRAARALQRESGTALGARMHLTKRIPIAAGLGGGSSDAAATLLGLNRLWGLGLGRDRLQAVAAGVGTDVPLFLSEAPFGVGRGRGELCEPVSSASRLAHVLVVPKERLSTKAVYGSAQFDLTAPKPSITMVLHALSNGSPGELAKGLWNDLEPEAIRRCPVISVIHTRLRSLGCLTTRVSGSGTAVFGLCADAAQAQDVVTRLRSDATPPWHVQITQTEQPSVVTTSIVP